MFLRRLQEWKDCEAQKQQVRQEVEQKKNDLNILRHLSNLQQLL